MADLCETRDLSCREMAGYAFGFNPPLDLASPPAALIHRVADGVGSLVKPVMTSEVGAATAQCRRSREGSSVDPIGIAHEKYKLGTRLTLRALLALY